MLLSGHLDNLSTTQSLETHIDVLQKRRDNNVAEVDQSLQLLGSFQLVGLVSGSCDEARESFPGRGGQQLFGELRVKPDILQSLLDVLPVLKTEALMSGVQSILDCLDIRLHPNL